MSSTSQKHRDFVSEPMGEKPVTELAGIGAVLGKRLADSGYVVIFTVYGFCVAPAYCIQALINTVV